MRRLYDSTKSEGRAARGPLEERSVQQVQPENGFGATLPAATQPSGRIQPNEAVHEDESGAQRVEVLASG